MTANDAAIRKAYQVAEDKDISSWVNCFTEDGTFTDESVAAGSTATTRGCLAVKVLSEGVISNVGANL